MRGVKVDGVRKSARGEWQNPHEACTIRYANDIDNIMRNGRQGLSVLASHMSGQYGNALMQGAMGAVGAYDSARSHVMSTHDDVLEKSRESGRVLEQLRNIPHEARPMYG